MVGSLADGRGERAQLILVGAIALAFLILGIVVVFNSAVHTQTAGQDGTMERAGEPPAVEAEIEGGVSEVVASVNADRDAGVEDDDPENGDGTTEESEEDEEEGDGNGNGPEPYQDDVVEAVQNNLSVFGDHYRHATAASRPALADVSFDDIDEDDATGTIVHQREFGEIGGNGDDDDDDGDGVRTVINEDGEADDIERFVLTLNTSDFDGLAVDFDGQEIGIDPADASVVVDDGENGPCELEPVAGTGENPIVTIDLLNAETDADEDCLEDLDLVSDYGSIDFVVEGEAVGTFELVVDADSDGIDPDFAYGDAVLTIDGTLTYESDELTYERQLEVDVYGDGS